MATSHHRKPSPLLGALSLPALLALSFPNVTPAQPLPVTEIDEYIRASVDLNQIPGLAVAVVQDGEIAFTQAYGVKNNQTGEPMSRETPVDLASVSKSFTALAVAQLCESGMLDVAAPIYEYLPELRVQSVEGWPEITVRDLLQHRSGFNRRADYLLPCCETLSSENLPACAGSA